ncbi:MAG: SpoIIE family protein phosphatase [Planctomycetota bacterium]
MTSPENVRSVALAVHSAPTLAELSASLPDVVLGLSGCMSVSVIFGTAESPAYSVQSSTLPHLPMGATVPPGEDAVSGTLRDGVLFHAEGDPPVVTWNGEATTIAASLPLAWQGQRYGALVLHDPVPAEAIGDLEALAEQLSLALVRIQLYEEAARDHQVSLAKLAAITQTGDLLRQLDLETLLVKVMELALSVVTAQVGSLLIREDGVLKTRVEWGLPEEAISGAKLADGRRVIDDVVERNEPLLSLSMGTDPQFVLEGMAANISNLLVIPLSTKDRAIGCLNIVNSEGAEFTKKDVEVLTTIAGLASTAIENAMLHKEALDQERFAEQLRVAGEIQRKLLPPKAPEVNGAEVEGWTQPCDDSGGDYFDYFALSDTRLGFCVGDVTGHGIGAALLMTTARAMIRSRVHVESDLGELFSRLNDLLCPDMGGEKFITLWYGVYDAVERSVTYASAGHDPPVLYRRAKDSTEELDSTGMPLGMMEGVPFGTGKVENLEVGDILLVMTDGVWEAMNPATEKYERERVAAHVRAFRDTTPRELVAGLYHSVKEFCGEAPQRDDITMVCLRVAPLVERPKEEERPEEEAERPEQEVVYPDEMPTFPVTPPE